MKDLGRLICHIPARKGSKRIPNKNLRYICGKPLIAYAIECAKEVGIFDEIYVNTDSKTLCALAEEYGVRYYLRETWLASDEAKGDDFTADFMEKHKPDTLLMINPVCPLIGAEDIENGINVYRKSNCDTLITCAETQMQVFHEGKGVNINVDAPLEPTQNNSVVKILNWAVTIWDTKTFLDTYRKHKRGYLGTNRILFPIDPLKAIKISQENDFQLAEMLIQVHKMQRDHNALPRYWSKGLRR
jgi:CMP-N,N'-diacetyllegionaminic acid synthase